MAKAKNSGKIRAPSRAADARGHGRVMGAKSRVLRIIGGKHRGRRLRFPGGVDIRPTPDRVRETLFNWLMPRIAGARVLDLFAGSGALGLEALSRGAAQVVFVERDRRAAHAIETIADEWSESAARVVCMDAQRWLGQKSEFDPFDIVFLDPPYDADLLGHALESLEKGGHVASDARVYVELRARDALPARPQGWQSIRDGTAGEVG